MSHAPLTYIMRKPPIGGLPLLVLFALCHHTRIDNGECYVGAKKIAESIGMSEKTIRRHLKALASAKIITRVSRLRESGARSTDTITIAGYLEWWNAQGGGTGTQPPQKPPKKRRTPPGQVDHPPGQVDQAPPGQVDQGPWSPAVQAMTNTFLTKKEPEPGGSGVAGAPPPGSGHIVKRGGLGWEQTLDKLQASGERDLIDKIERAGAYHAVNKFWTRLDRLPTPHAEATQ